MSSSQSSRSPSPDIIKELKDEKKSKSKSRDQTVKEKKSKKDDKKREKTKGKSKKSSTTEPRNEGQARNWAYKPPDGMVELDLSQIDEEFDWDALNDDEDKELCLFRLPDGLRVKHLDGIELPISTNIGEKSQKVTAFERKRSKLEIWSVGTGLDDLDGERNTRGQELRSISCLLPRSHKKGALQIAPKPIMHRFIVIHSPAISSTQNESPTASTPREVVPPEVLKHRFIPYGAESRQPEQDVTDVMEIEPPSNTLSSSPIKLDSPRKSTKKRKSGRGDTEEPSPKKSKKLKAQ